jgi:hypothetical protein
LSRPDGPRVESEPHERLDRRVSSGTAERFSDANWTGRRPASGSSVPVPAMTGSVVVEVGNSIRRLPCQIAGTETGCRTTSGAVPMVGCTGRSWPLMPRILQFACHRRPGCGRWVARLCACSPGTTDPSWRRDGCIFRETRCLRRRWVRLPARGGGSCRDWRRVHRGSLP